MAIPFRRTPYNEIAQDETRLKHAAWRYTIVTIEDDYGDGSKAASASGVTPNPSALDSAKPEDNAGQSDGVEGTLKASSIFGLSPLLCENTVTEKTDTDDEVAGHTDICDDLASANRAGFGDAFQGASSSEYEEAGDEETSPDTCPDVSLAASLEVSFEVSLDMPVDPPLCEEQLEPALTDDDENAVADPRSVASPSSATESLPEGVEPRWLGVRFSKTGQVYFIPDKNHVVRRGTKVLVEQETGSALGEIDCIIESGKLLTGTDITSPGKKILGLATAQDIARHTENSILADEAEAFCKTCIRQRELDMKLVEVEVLHDRSKIIFYFTAPTRIDFRELVKDLVRNYRTRIELRQIGVRHESQMIGGLGNCGMVCCCHQYLRKFAPVTIKMAKEQNLFLNPAKLSGMCGRLLCCLSFEQGNYEEFNRRCPKIGKRYSTEERGTVRILRANMFSQSLAVQGEGGEEWELSLDEWEGMHPRRAEPQPHDTSRPFEAQHTADEGGKRGKYKKEHPPRHQQGEHRQEREKEPACNRAGAPVGDAAHGGSDTPHHARRGGGKPRPPKRTRQRE